MGSYRITQPKMSFVISVEFSRFGFGPDFFDASLSFVGIQCSRLQLVMPVHRLISMVQPSIITIRLSILRPEAVKANLKELPPPWGDL